MTDPLIRLILALWDCPDPADLAPLAQAAGAMDFWADLARLRRESLEEHGPTDSAAPPPIPLRFYQDVLEHERDRRGWSLGSRIMVFRRTTSTNDVCWKSAEAGPHGLVVIADEQARGRGRRGNPWFAEPGDSVLMSVLLKNAAPLPADAERLTLLAGLAVAEAFDALTGASPRALIKWPNDVLLAEPTPASAPSPDPAPKVAPRWGGQKVAGILVERRDADVVIGIGANVAQGAPGRHEFPADLVARATSLFCATGRRFDRLRLIAAMLDALHGRLARPVPQDLWLAAWKSRCAMLGQPAALVHNARPLAGQVVDIDPTHGLVLRDATGAMHFLSAQTTTLSP